MWLFLVNTFPLWWILLAVVVLRSFRSASNHDEEFESSAGAPNPLVDRPSTWHKCPHNIISGGHAA
jgi:hypothetical protein